MAQHRGQLVLVLRHGEDARVHAHLAAGQGERVGFLVHEYRGFPGDGALLGWQLAHQRVDHAVDVGVLLRIPVGGFLGLGLGKGLRPQLVQLLLGNAANHLGPPGGRGGGGTGDQQRRNRGGKQPGFHGGALQHGIAFSVGKAVLTFRQADAAISFRPVAARPTPGRCSANGRQWAPTGCRYGGTARRRRRPCRCKPPAAIRWPPRCCR